MIAKRGQLQSLKSSTRLCLDAPAPSLQVEQESVHAKPHVLEPMWLGMDRFQFYYTCEPDFESLQSRAIPYPSPSLFALQNPNEQCNYTYNNSRRVSSASSY